jgi:single-strand DNA-binding protein
MSKSINQVLLIGNVGKNSEVRTLENNVKVATFSLATSTGGYRKQDGTEVPEKIQWHNIVCWRSLAELVEKFIHKGDKVTIFGTINYREYEKDSVKRYITDIVAYDIVLNGKNDSPNAKPPITENDMPTQADFPPLPSSTKDDLPF